MLTGAPRGVAGVGTPIPVCQGHSAGVGVPTPATTEIDTSSDSDTAIATAGCITILESPTTKALGDYS